MPKFRVTLTRLIEEEACIFLNARDREAAIDEAIDLVGEIASTVWVRSDTEPHTYNVDKVEATDHKGDKT